MRIRDVFDEEDVLPFAGLALVSVGAGMAWLPAGLMAGGIGLMGIGLKWLIRMPRFTEDQIKRIDQIEREKGA
jgi:hypothetical protein